MNQKWIKNICVILFILICAVLFMGQYNKQAASRNAYMDGIEQIDINRIFLGKSGVEVNFSEVIVGTHQETRKLIVSTQEAVVSTELTYRLIKPLDFDFMKKTQKLNYTGTGYFVVDLDNLTKDNVIQNRDHKIITIQIDHAYLHAIEIDPNKIIIDDVKESLLARGDIELTLKDYNTIEKELRNRLEAKFDTAENGQKADTIALQMVKDVYEPLIKAIDASYELHVEFK